MSNIKYANRSNRHVSKIPKTKLDYNMHPDFEEQNYFTEFIIKEETAKDESLHFIKHSPYCFAPDDCFCQLLCEGTTLPLMSNSSEKESNISENIQNKENLQLKKRKHNHIKNTDIYKKINAMATRLAPQRNFVRITQTDEEDVTMTSTSSSNDENITNSTNGQSNVIPIQHVLQQKKLIFQTSASNVSAVDIVPIEGSDSSNEPPAGSIKSETGVIAAVPEQQVTAQVAVVQAENPEDDMPHYITVTVSSQDSSHNTYHVQYVDSELYSTPGQAQTQMGYPVYAVGDYSGTSQQYYATGANYGSPSSNNAASSYNIVPVDETLLSAQASESPQSISAEVAYIQGPQSSSSASVISVADTECTPNLSHATRVSPATVSWLLENYETAEGVSLPRSTLYNHYMRHCNENKLDAVNAASFGKLIRSVFTGLRTRRLGTRGNSKYHYYGIRVKPGSHLMSALDEKPHNSPANNSSSNHTSNRSSRKGGSKPETYEACSQYLGDGSGSIPIFPSIDVTQPFPKEITLEDVDTLRSIYREHCEAFLDAILNLEFSTVESLWREFWRSQNNNNGDECEEEKYLSKSKLYILCECEPIQNFIKQVDLAFYQNMVDVLIPDVLRPIPSSLTQAIRNFSKNLENWLSSSMSGCPDKILQIKLSSVAAFGQTLRRYTSLNHLAQAARAVLQNSSQIAQMLNDLNRVDFHNVHEQASWVCQCDTNTVQRLVNDFKAALQQQNSLEQWASWLRLVVDSALEEYQGKPTYARAARQFLLKWSFYSSMVIRDLTLRSAASFGSFHLIRLLYDEYMFFIVEHKVALATDTKPIAVMSESNKSDGPINEHLLIPNEIQLKVEPDLKRMRS